MSPHDQQGDPAQGWRPGDLPEPLPGDLLGDITSTEPGLDVLLGVLASDPAPDELHGADAALAMFRATGHPTIPVPGPLAPNPARPGRAGAGRMRPVRMRPGRVRPGGRPGGPGTRRSGWPPRSRWPPRPGSPRPPTPRRCPARSSTRRIRRWGSRACRIPATRRGHGRPAPVPAPPGARARVEPGGRAAAVGGALGPAGRLRLGHPTGRGPGGAVGHGRQRPDHGGRR